MAEIELWKDYKVLNLLARRLELMPKFFAKTFFSNKNFHDTEEIHFSDDSSSEGISAFCHPLAEGRVILDQGAMVKSFAPAYIKETCVFDLLKALKVLPDEDYSGSRTPEQRRKFALARDVARLVARFHNRIELMALEALRDGRATIKGNGVNAVLDYGRDPTLKEIATDDQSKWSNPDFSILSQLTGMKQKIKSKSRHGAIANDIYLNQNTVNHLEKNKEIRELLDLRRGVNLGIEMTPHQDYEDMEYWGKIGSFKFWVHSGTYQDEKQMTHPIIKDGQVILTAKNIHGKRHFGRIISQKAKYKPLEMFLRPFHEERTETDHIEIHSSPLLIPHDVNAAGYMEVL